MASNTEPLSIEEGKQLVSIATQALRAEDEEIRCLLRRFGSRYDDHSHGLGAFFENGMVYVIWKQLLRAEWPFKVIMEHRYPGNRALHADLALADEAGVRAFLEFKVWSHEDAEDVAGDVRKLRAFAGGVQKLMLVVSIGGDLEGNRRFLLDRLRELRLVDSSQFQTQIQHDGRQHAKTVDVALYSVVEG